jgi:hypothetical protein
MGLTGPEITLANCGSLPQAGSLNPRRKIASMKAPPRLQALIDEGLIDTVVRQRMSGKEATYRSFRQAVDAAGNNQAQRKLLRTDYGPEIWSLHQAGALTNDTVLAGQLQPTGNAVDPGSHRA